jgi:hypothetical protein
MRVGDLVRHSTYPRCFGVVMRSEGWVVHIGWIPTPSGGLRGSSYPTPRGARSRHSKNNIELISEGQ